jgi:HEAT repeat protein
MRGDDIWTRAAATGALIQIGAPAVDGLAEALTDDAKVVRRAAAKALGKIAASGDSVTVRVRLSQALNDQDKGVRRFAAQALGRLEADSAVPALIEALADDNAEVRLAALTALANIDTEEARVALDNWRGE